MHVTSRLVVLDVVVTDAHGNPVRGLKPSDFALLEDGVPQKLAAFTEYDAYSLVPAPSAPSLPNTFAVQPPPPESDTKTVIVIADSAARNPNSEMPLFPSFQTNLSSRSVAPTALRFSGRMAAWLVERTKPLPPALKTAWTQSRTLSWVLFFS